MKIANIQLKSPVVLAPLAGISNLPFRRICSQLGAGMVTTEMVSSKAMVQGNRATRLLLRTDDTESPKSVQIFGREPSIMAETARILNDTDFDTIDINMGCPAAKIVKNGEGSALMKSPELIDEIVRSVVKASTKPVTAKIRLGFDFDSINCVKVARIVENAGASAITVHGRTRSQMFGGEACWEGIKTVKDAVNVPVIGNGDVKCPIQTKKWMEESCVDAVMIGRGSYGDPWVFKRIATYLETGELLALPTFQERIGMAISHTKAAIDHDGEKIALREMRKHIAWYIKGLRDATIAKVAINNSQSFEEIYDILTNLSKSNIIES